MRVLVADDDDGVRRVVSEALGDAGYECVPARDGVEALRLARAAPPDAIVLDVVMPNAGAAVFRAVQVGMTDVAGVPVLLMSATRAADLGGIARDLGAAEAIAKPFDAERFLAAIARLVGA